MAVYDLSRSAGWAAWRPGLLKPVHGPLQLPPPRTTGSVGPALKLLFDHIAWVDRRFGLAHIGFEAFLAATGGKKDDDTSFVTSPKTQKLLIGQAGVTELAAEIMGIESHALHNMSWRRYWLGKQPRGTKRDTWKALSVAKAQAMGWGPHDDNDADACGQLAFLMDKLGIAAPWAHDPAEPVLLV